MLFSALLAAPGAYCEVEGAEEKEEKEHYSMEFAQERAEEQLAKREDQPHFLNIRRSGINPTASRSRPRT